MGYIISGIQQVGIGVNQVYEAWEWYRKHLGMDLAVFDEAAEANLMLPYTADKPQKRHAILAMNYQGGSGLEIWQYTSRTPSAPEFRIQLGDLGILATKFKTDDVIKTFKRLRLEGVTLLTNPEDSKNSESFFGLDPWGNLFQIVKKDDWFSNPKTNGGVCGAIVGVSNLDQSLPFYQELLGYDVVLMDETSEYDDFNKIESESYQYRRVILTHSQKRKGAFAPLLGNSEIELVEVKGREPRKIFKDRLWGDLGYIHLCFDVADMENLKEKSEEMGHPFTIDSDNSFDMGEAAGRFTYTEDPDGTLIEFVETHKVPIMKSVKWYLDLTKRNKEKPLPRYLLKAMFMNRTKKPVWPR